VTGSPLLTTPSFPEYVSGHSTFSGAAAAVLTEFFGTDAVHFTVLSDSVARRGAAGYDSFAKTAEEIGQSRIYGGIHFPSADRNGRKAAKLWVNMSQIIFTADPLKPHDATERLSRAGEFSRGL